MVPLWGVNGAHSLQNCLTRKRAWKPQQAKQDWERGRIADHGNLPGEPILHLNKRISVAEREMEGAAVGP